MFGFFTVSSPVRQNGITVYPIPSYEVEVNGFANFRESSSPNSFVIPAGRRDINVIITSSYPHGNAQATVWFYSLDSLEIMGPFSISEYEILTESIDFKTWGALVESDEDILASVWTGNNSQPLLYRRSSKTNFKMF